MKTKFNLFIALTFSFLYSFAQNGTIKGTIFDDENNDPVFGVTVTIEKNNTTDPNLATVVTGTMSDLDGKFSVMVPPGVYNIRFRNMSYQNLLIENVDIKAKGLQVFDEIRLKSSTTKLEEIVISGSKIQNTEESVLQDKKNSTNLKDGISAAAFKKVGDSDAASSMKRVTGVSVQDGKYVYVRGLGDRYNKTILNGMDIPGLDPDKNSLQMDIFPTSLIDNITVHKSFSAELPADFSGGVIDISTKEFPDKKEASLSLSSGYNNLYHFNPNYLTYKGGSTDFLGFDDGTRAIPAGTNFPLQANALFNNNDYARFNQVLTSFNPTMAAMQQNSLMDFSLGSTYGNQKVKEKYTLGYSIGADYKNNTTFYKDALFARYGMYGEADRTELELREKQIGNYGENNVLLSTFGGLSLKTKQSKYNLKALHLQNGESKAGIFDYISNNQGANFEGFQHNLEYSQKQLTNVLLNGKHNFEEKKLEIDWKVAGTLSVMNDPDIRFTRYQVKNQSFDMNTESGFPQRIWRSMNENNLSSVLHFTKKLTIKEREAKFKYGGAFTYKERDFLIQSFSIVLNNPNRTQFLTGDPNEIFASNNLWTRNPDPTSLQTIYNPDFVPFNPNQFTANSLYGAAYTSIEMEYFKNLKSVIGLRVEQFQQRYTGRDQAGANILNNQKVLDDFDFFPTVNLVYAVNDTQNIRFSYSKTIARPSMKEMSFAEILDPLTGRSFSGGMFRDANDQAGIEYWNGRLISSDIHNLDARWELFQKKGQIISVSSFYKKFINPIEIVQFASKANAFQPRNVGNGDLLGIELELRKNLSFLTSKLEKISFNVNYTLTQSRIEMSKTERDSRVENAREGQEIGKYRDMAGQSPYLVNVGLSYDGAEKGFLRKLQFGLYYNVQGPTLTFVGMVDRPDVYTVPFHSLNFNGSKAFGKNDNMNLALKVSNLLLDKKELVFDSFGAKDEYFTQLNIGILTKLSFSMKF
jgi:TonB-dependent receptor